MCDYSLHLVASRPAKVGDKLVSTSFPETTTRGFASVDDRNVAVCLLPGTELAFENEVRCETAFVLRSTLGHTVAKFQQVNKGRSDIHHDALEFPDGKIVLLTHLCKGQRATVLQLPARPPWARPEWSKAANLSVTTFCFSTRMARPRSSRATKL